MFRTSWPRLQRHWQMSSYEAKVVQVIISAAVAEYQRTREFEASVPLASVVEDPTDEEALASLSGVLSKAWHLRNSQQMYGFSIVVRWIIDHDSKNLSFRVSQIVMDLFDGIDMSESPH